MARRIAIGMIQLTNLPDVAKDILKNKIKPVYTRQPNIGDIAMNFMKMAKGMNIEDYQCVCGTKNNKGNHMIFKIKDIQDDIIKPLQLHQKVVPLPDDPGTWRGIFHEFQKLKKMLGKVDKNIELCNTYEYVRGWMEKRNTKQVKADTYISAHATRKAVRKLKGWLITYADKNPGMLIACCPMWYYDKMNETFKCNGTQDSYIKIDTTEDKLLNEWHNFYKQNLQNIGMYFNKKGRIPYGYILPKFKDLNKTRPIVSYYYHPLRRILNLFARALTFLLKTCTVVKHLTIWNTDALIANIQLQTNGWMERNNHQYDIITGDIKNMYTMLPPEEMIQAVEWLLQHVIPRRREQYITIKKRGRDGARFGRTYNRDTHTEIKITQIITIVQFDTNNCFFKTGPTILKQVWGVPMGSPMSPIIAILVCARREHYCLNGLQREINMIRAFRYVDDMMIILKYKKNKRYLTERIANKIMNCYHQCMEMNIEQYDRTVNFLEYKIAVKDNKIIIGHLCKNEEHFMETGTLKFMKLPEATSFVAKKQKLGMIIGNFCRIKRHCSNLTTLALAMEQTCTEMKVCGYGKKLLIEALEFMYSKTGEEIWQTFKKLPIFGRVTF